MCQDLISLYSNVLPFAGRILNVDARHKLSKYLVSIDSWTTIAEMTTQMYPSDLNFPARSKIDRPIASRAGLTSARPVEGQAID